MNPTSSRRGSILVGILATVSVLVIVAVIGIVNLITLTRDASALRRALVSVDGLDPQLRVQASVGPVITSTVRLGLRLIDEVPPEAHQALAAVRGASVAVYQLEAAPGADTVAAMVQAGARVMADRGWTRVVTVRDQGDTVLIFTPRDTGTSKQVRVCVAVCSGRELVVAEARLVRDELAALISTHCPKLEI